MHEFCVKYLHKKTATEEKLYYREFFYFVEFLKKIAGYFTCKSEDFRPFAKYVLTFSNNFQMAPKVGVKEVSIHNFAFMPFRLLSFVTLVKFFFKRYKRPGLDQNPAMEWCYETLVMQSKPYSYIIAQLPENLKDVFVVCYLWARTADTIGSKYIRS